jgi:pyruvate,water dikinase
MSYVVWLSDVNDKDKAIVGSKAARLGSLLAAGFSVPPGFCITQSAYNKAIQWSGKIDLPHLVSERHFAEIRNRIQHIELDQSLASDIAAKYRHLRTQYSYPIAVAVRSSSTAEDLTQHSFAGLYETILHVMDEPTLLAAIQGCWASYWSEEAVFYREQVGLDHTQHGMALLVQVMIEPHISGVLFTQNPLNHRQNELVVEVVQGVAESLVSGDIKGLRFLINRETHQIDSPSSLETDLDVSFLERLLSIGLAIEQYQGKAQDVEWAIDAANQVWVLQTRPVTGIAIAQISSQNNAPDGWQRAYDEPFSPLGCDLAIRRHSYWLQAINAHYKTNFASEIKNVNNLLYFNPTWRMSGRLTRLWMGFWKILHWLQAGQIYKRYTNQIIPAHEQRLAKLAAQNISKLDTRDLLAGFDASIQIYLDLQYASYPLIEVIKTSIYLFERLCRLWLKQDSNLRVSDFLGGLDNLTVARDLALHRLGEALGKILSPQELQNLNYDAFLTLKDLNATANQFWTDLQTFLQDYGYVWADRYPRDPAWEINQEALIASLSHIAQITAKNKGLVYHHIHQKQSRIKAIDQALQQLSKPGWLSFRAYIFRRILHKTEQLFPHKENRNHYVYQAVMVIRRYSQEIGRRLQAQHLLQSEKDIFFLAWAEIQELLSNKNCGAKLRQRIEDRKQIYYQSKGRLEIVPNNGIGPQNENPLTGNNPYITNLLGEPCSPGVVTGSARLVNGLSELQRVQPGDIMVCSHLRPAWSTVFVRAGGVVVETGSLLSHGATLAREYGIPAVMNIPGITQSVAEGDKLTVDGYLGTIVVEKLSFKNKLLTTQPQTYLKNHS